MPADEPNRPPPPKEPENEEYLLVSFGHNCPDGPLGPEVLAGKGPAGKIIIYAPLGPDPRGDETP